METVADIDQVSISLASSRPADGVEEVSPSEANHVLTLSEFLVQLCDPLIAVSHVSLRETLTSDVSRTFLKEFIMDPSSPMLIIQALYEPGNLNEGEQLGTYSPHVTNEFLFDENQCVPQTVVIIRRTVPVSFEASLSTQISVCQFHEGRVLDDVLTYIRHCFHPISKTLVKDAMSTSTSKDRLVEQYRSVNGKIGELEVELVRSTQNVHVSPVTLEVVPEITELCRECSTRSKKATVEMLEKYTQNHKFLTKLEKSLREWKSRIATITSIQREVTDGTALDEINYWSNLLHVLRDIDEQLNSDPIKLTFEVLRHKRRFHAITGFHDDSGFSKFLSQVESYFSLLRALPIRGILSASSFSQLKASIQPVFAHLGKQAPQSMYPIERVKQLVHVISKEVVVKLQDLLVPEAVLTIEKLSALSSLLQQVDRIVVEWGAKSEEFENIVRKMKTAKGSAKRNYGASYKWEQKNILKVLKSRLDSITSWRVQHNELRNALEITFEREKSQLERCTRQIEEARQCFESVDPLDITDRGKTAWGNTIEDYEQTINRVETEVSNRIQRLLDSQIGDPDAMLRICEKFNSLFKRRRIQAAVQPYQESLIGMIKEKIARLQKKYRVKYASSETRYISEALEIPSVSGKIMWYKQIERQIGKNEQRVFAILGEDWSHHTDGRALISEMKILKERVKPKEILDQWLQDVHKYTIELHALSGPLFEVRTRGKEYHLDVNFDAELVNISCEVHCLLDLGYELPFNLKTSASEARSKYPFAQRLKESLGVIRTSLKLHKDSHFGALTRDIVRDLYSVLLESAQVQWSSVNIEQYVAKLSQKVAVVDETGKRLAQHYDEVEEAIQGIEAASIEEISSFINRIQSIVENLERLGCSNIALWTEATQKRIDMILAVKLQQQLKKWRRIKEGESDEVSYIDIDIQLKNQTLQAIPSIETARKLLYVQVYSLIGKVCNLPRIQSHWHVENNQIAQSTTVWSYIPQKDVEKCLDTIERIYWETKEYLNSWLMFQNIFDAQLGRLYDSLGDDLLNWYNCLIEIRKGRITFDTSQSEWIDSLNRIRVRFSLIQNKVSVKYDQLHRHLVEEFGRRCHIQMEEDMKQTQLNKEKLEAIHFDRNTTKVSLDLVANMNKVNEIRQSIVGDQSRFQIFDKCEKLLKRHRYVYPQEWIYCESLEAERGAIEQRLGVLEQDLEQIVPLLKRKVQNQQDELVNEGRRVGQEWKENRPSGTSEDPSDVLVVVDLFKQRLKGLNEQREHLLEACKALGIPYASRDEDLIDQLVTEIDGLDEVWRGLQDSWQKIAAIEQEFVVQLERGQPRKLLEHVQTNLRNMSNRVRMYEAHRHLSRTVEKRLSANGLLMELTLPILTAKHHHQLLSEFGFETDRLKWSQVTLGHLWRLELGLYETKITEIVQRAKGEVALEEFLTEIQTKIENLKFECSTPKEQHGRTIVLLLNCSDLLDTLQDDLTSLDGCKRSPYYSAFKTRVLELQIRLDKSLVILDSLIEVQKKWIYLSGIFLGGGDVQTQLLQQYTMFKTVDQELVRMLSYSIATQPYLHEYNSEERTLISKLESSSRVLDAIQAALSSYLESQRNQFPRFYFVGDEDLLEIIGNARDPQPILRHLPKMFAGIHSLSLETESEHIIGIESAEGETMTFESPIAYGDSPNTYSWLSSIETQMRNSLLKQIVDASSEIETAYSSKEELKLWKSRYVDQAILLATQIYWTKTVERDVTEKSIGLFRDHLSKVIEWCLEEIQEDIEISALAQSCTEHLIMELVHQHDILEELSKLTKRSCSDWCWLKCCRVYLDAKTLEIIISIGTASLVHGLEYVGVGEKLVQTYLSDECYLILAQALCNKLGGNPLGPAGTGKTETVKALGNQLGRFVVVFNCDATFDLDAMSRLFRGLCQCGAWGCFDEFNRLESITLSSVSQEIQIIQSALKRQKQKIELAGSHSMVLHPNVGIFVTMNPSYAGRSTLPNNLQQLFRCVAMVRPDNSCIARVLLYAQGLHSAEDLANQIVSLFSLLKKHLSSQSHYDFGLRALKSVLRIAGSCLRGQRKLEIDSTMSKQENEQILLLQSIRDTIVPKLVQEDVRIFEELVETVFQSNEKVSHSRLEAKELEGISQYCRENHLVCSDAFMEKLFQLDSLCQIHNGLIFVGEAGSSKSSVWQTYLSAIQPDAETYIICPKALSSKARLYGSLNPTTLEWHDGIFTSILRRIVANERGELHKYHWIIFDSDIDPEWAENLNSVLDDNRVLTLPSGERIALPSCVRILFEVDSLEYATPATVSRCGMIWFETNLITSEMRLSGLLSKLRNICLTDINGNPFHDWKRKQARCVEVVQPIIESGVSQAIKWLEEHHSLAMGFNVSQLIDSFYDLVRYSFSVCLSDPSFDSTISSYRSFLIRNTLSSLLWSFGGAGSPQLRTSLLHSLNVDLQWISPLSSKDEILACNVMYPSGNWIPWSECVQTVNLEAYHIVDPDIVIQTSDILQLTTLLGRWLEQERPILLVGPAGTGKSMLLYDTVRKDTSLDLVLLNFSSATTCASVIDTLLSHCEVVRERSKYVLRPRESGKRLVVFCDEINLPAPDRYGTQAVNQLLCMILEHQAIWYDSKWIELRDIRVLAACNPSTDAGRTALSPRFLRHFSILYIDFPSRNSLVQIYQSFVRAWLVSISIPIVENETCLTQAMVDIYEKCQTVYGSQADKYSHYVYSPRELSRWIRALYLATQMNPRKQWQVPELLDLWAHEALRLFSDRLVTAKARDQLYEMIESTIQQYFPKYSDRFVKSKLSALIYSSWIDGLYEKVSLEEMRTYVNSRLDVFREEQMQIKIVLFDDVLYHLSRIDRILKQPLGHALLVGSSGSGKTLLSQFCAWMNGMSVFQIKVHREYTSFEFDKDLRSVLIRAGVERESICFIFDESNVVDSSFLERMNSLLASGEVPGLFQGTEYDQLMASCREQWHVRDGEEIQEKSNDQIWKLFRSQIQQNLHIIFTMNPSNSDFDNRNATSPALFNRCVTDWFGEWSSQALQQTGRELFEANSSGICSTEQIDAVVDSLVFVHQSTFTYCNHFRAQHGRCTYVTPRHYLDLINSTINLMNEKKSFQDNERLRLSKGLGKLRNASNEIGITAEELTSKKESLKGKEIQASETLEKIMKNKKKLHDRRVRVERELSQIAPALLEAESSLKQIKKEHLDEVRAFANPPSLVKLTLEATVMTLGNTTSVADWKTIRKEIRKSDFISTILKFDVAHAAPKVMKKLKDDYFSNSDFTFEKVNRSSKACGPLVKWLHAQLMKSKVEKIVDPLRVEMKQVQDSAQVLESEYRASTEILQDIETKLEEYKSEFRSLSGEIERIKHETIATTEKVGRSSQLLQSLTHEKERWEELHEDLSDDVSTIVVDSLLSAAYLAYTGYFDHEIREYLLQKWIDYLTSRLSGTIYSFANLVDYLSNASQRLKWNQDYGLITSDPLCLGNGIMLQRFRRYPLVIDPSGQAMKYFQQMYKERLEVTSFFNRSDLLKKLINCIRFGNVLIVEDVDYFDPLLNPVLNHEVHNIGGRTFVRIGDRDVDMSPSFRILLVTQNTQSHFTPDLCSRVTFINFTVTTSSVESQCLHKLLLTQRPELEQQRTQVIQEQDALRVHLTNLELQVLQQLAESEGQLLESTALLDSLEQLQQQAKETSSQIEKLDATMKQITSSLQQYQSLAKDCAQICLVLRNLSNTSPELYNITTQSYLRVVDHAFSSYNSRDEFLPHLLDCVYHRFSYSLREVDRRVLAAALCHIAHPDLMGWHELKQAPLAQFTHQCHTIVDSVCPQFHNPMETNSLNTVDEFLHQTDYDSIFSILVVTFEGIDCSEWIEQTAEHRSKSLRVITLGGSKSLVEAEQAIEDGILSNSWIYLRNLHVALDWVNSSLDQMLHQKSRHLSSSSFRLFFSCEYTDGLSSTFLARSKLLILQPSPGLKSALRRQWKQVEPERCESHSYEWTRLYFLVTYLHVLLRERLRYVPQCGWTKSYNICAADFVAALSSIDSLARQIAPSELQHHIDPDLLPYDALQNMLQFYSYGGRMDREIDRECLKSLITSFFIPGAFDRDFSLTHFHSTCTTQLLLPESITYTDIAQWVESLDDQLDYDCTLLGLPPGADLVMQREKGRVMSHRLFALIEHRQQQKVSESKAKETQFGSQIAPKVKEIMQELGESIIWNSQSPEPELVALSRCLQHEVAWLNDILQIVQRDCSAILELMSQTEKTRPSSLIQALVKSLKNNKVPGQWDAITTKALDEWIIFMRKQSLLLSEFTFESPLLWIGGLKWPQIFFSCGRQIASRLKHHPLSGLRPVLASSRSSDGLSICMKELYLCGAIWNQENGIEVSAEASDLKGIYFPLPELYLSWTASSAKDLIALPLFQDESRNNVIDSVLIRYNRDIAPISEYHIRGICFIARLN